MSISMLYMTKKSDKKWKKAILKGPPLGPQGESFYENPGVFRDKKEHFPGNLGVWRPPERSSDR